MRILISSCPAYGHLLPMLPLARAAQRAGHDVALMTHPSVAAQAPSLPLLAAGPSIEENLAEVFSRSGRDVRDVSLDEDADTASTPIDFFVDARMDLGAAQALAVVKDFAPDLVVADMADHLGPLAAAAIGVPWAVHGGSLPLYPGLAVRIEEAAVKRYAQEGVVRTQPLAYLDPWPQVLLDAADHYPVERIAVQAEPHAGEGPTWQRPAFSGREDRPTVLLTLGTVVEDPQALGAALDSLLEYDVNVVVAPHTPGDLGDRVLAEDRVRVAGFVPMRDLLDSGIDVVVSAAGAGTVLSSLAVGVPMVLLPFGLDKPMNAARVASVGAGKVVSSPGDVGAAVEKVLGETSFESAAAGVAEAVRAGNTADEALSLLLARAASVS
ncbi:glycosyltransferase [Kineosporia mesophila]|uniref:Glycosyltransferase n=1 Tax=Kineosporia mesophila TaxID=566012 RepID=A0ABP7A2G4_9ACTN|nr:glycosyltransferase [Kineosporia mesophila]MCD5348993.1 glycosyltransferase [Kineosporia mesophila]